MRVRDLDSAFLFFILCFKETKREVKGPPQQPVPRWGVLISLCSKRAVVEQEQSILQKQSPLLAHFHLVPQLSEHGVFCLSLLWSFQFSRLLFPSILTFKFFIFSSLLVLPPPPTPTCGIFFPSFPALPLHTSYVSCTGTVLKQRKFLSVLSFQCFVLAFHIFRYFDTVLG